MNENRVEIILTTDASGAITGYKMVGDIHTQTMDKVKAETQSTTAFLKQNWLEFTAAAYGAWRVVSEGLDLATLGAKAQQAGDSFRQVAESYHVDSAKMLADLKTLSAGTVDDSDLMQRAIRGLTQGLSQQQITALMGIARSEAKRTGQDVVTVFDEITNAIANDMPRSLRQMGLITREQMNLVSRAMAAGADDVKLYDIVLANATIHQAAMGKEVVNTAEKLQQLHAAWVETKETIGKGLVDLVDGAKQFGKSVAEDIVKAMALAVRGMLELAVAADTQLNKIGFISDKRLADDTAALEKLRNFKITTPGGEEQVPGVPSDKAVADAKKRLQDLEAELKKAAGAKEAAQKAQELANAMVDWDGKIQALNPDLDETTKQIIALWTEADKLRLKFGDKAWISQGLAQGIESLSDKKVMEDKLKDWDLTERIQNAYVQNQIASYELGERIHEAAKKNAQEQLKFQEAEINNQLTSLDISEKEHALSPVQLVQQRIALEEQLLAVEEKMRAESASSKNLEGWISINSEISQTQKKLLDLQQTQKELTGTFTEGLVEGITRYLETAQTKYQGALAMVQEVTQGMSNAFDQFFDYQSSNFMKFGVLIESIINDIYKQLVKILIIQPLINSIVGGVGSLIPGLIPGSGITLNAGLSSPGFTGLPSLNYQHFAGGGYVDRPTFAMVGEKEPEVIIPVSKMKQSSPDINVEVNVENRSSTPLTATKGPVRFDETARKFVVGVFLDDWNGYGPIRQTVNP